MMAKKTLPEATTLPEAVKALLGFLDTYPPHFHDGRSMSTDLSGYLEEVDRCLQQPQQGLRLKWFKLTKRGTVGALGRDAPPETGVGIASCQVPLLNDPQITLNFISCDGDVVSCDMCHHGQSRHRWLEEAKRMVR